MTGLDETLVMVRTLAGEEEGVGEADKPPAAGLEANAAGLSFAAADEDGWWVTVTVMVRGGC